MAQANATEAGRLERTAPYLKQSQIDELQGERDRLANTLNAPPHLRRAIHDPALMAKTLRGIEKTLHEDTPLPYQGAEQDAAVKRERELREAFVADMPTQAEMRRNPPGALDKHIMWEQKHEARIGEWKNIRRRMLAGGMLPGSMSERSASNVEMYRPAGGSGELNMDNAQIPQVRTISLGQNRSSTLSERDIDIIRLLAPDVYEKLALLSADQRDDLKAAIGEGQPIVDPASLDFDAMSHKEARDRLRAADLETGGSRDDLIRRLKEHYAADKDA